MDVSDEKQTAPVNHLDEVKDTGLAVQLAHDVEGEKASPWTRSMFRLYLVLGCAYLCGCLVCSPFHNRLMCDVD